MGTGMIHTGPLGELNLKQFSIAVRTPAKNKLAFRILLAFSLSICGMIGLSPVIVTAQSPAAGQALPLPAPPFDGTIGQTYKDSKSDFPQPVKPPAGAPNVLVILVDDLGFGGTEPFGGLIPTPNID